MSYDWIYDYPSFYSYFLRGREYVLVKGGERYMIGTLETVKDRYLKVGFTI